MAKRYIIIEITVGVILIALICIGVYLSPNMPTVHLTGNEAGCLDLFGCTPEEVLKQDLAIFEEIGDFRGRSYIDEQGVFHIILTREQVDKWLESEWLLDVPIPEDLSNPEKLITDIEISSDCQSITYYCSEKERANASADDWQTIQVYLENIFNRMTIFQILSGVPDGERQIVYRIIDIDTGAVAHEEILNP